MPMLRSAHEFHLPRSYRQQQIAHTRDDAISAAGLAEQEYWNPDRIRASARFQHHVYRWGAQLVRRRGLRSVLDAGCGPGTKLASLIAPHCSDIAGIDQPSALAAARRAGVRADFRAVDLDRCEGVPAHRTFDLIICADVLEHLIDPDHALEFLARHCHPATLVLLSTPDRARLRGRACMASDKPEHIREWSTPEFLSYLRSRGWKILRSRLLPAADEPAPHGVFRDLLWRAHLAPDSPRRCHTVLCCPACIPSAP